MQGAPGRPPQRSRLPSPDGRCSAPAAARAHSPSRRRGWWPDTVSASALDRLPDQALGVPELANAAAAVPAAGAAVTGRERSWPTGSRCPCARCGATSTGYGSWATRCRRTAGSTAATNWPRAQCFPPLVLDDEEAVALAVGLHAATSIAAAGMAEWFGWALTQTPRRYGGWTGWTAGGGLRQ